MALPEQKAGLQALYPLGFPLLGTVVVGAVVVTPVGALIVVVVAATVAVVGALVVVVVGAAVVVVGAWVVVAVAGATVVAGPAFWFRPFFPPQLQVAIQLLLIVSQE